MPVEHYGSFVSLVPSPLSIGTLELADGCQVQGFLCEPQALQDTAQLFTHEIDSHRAKHQESAAAIERLRARLAERESAVQSLAAR